MIRVLADPGSPSTHHLLLVIVGPTAVGKTAFAIRAARHFQTEIISSDSRQFYREMRIGTAVPSDAELSLAPHHFIGHLSVHDDYNVYRFEKKVLQLLEKLFRDHPIVVMTGGSGLYVGAVIRGIDDLPDPDPVVREQLKAKWSGEGIGALQKMLQELDPEYYDAVDKNNPKRLLRAIEICLVTGRSYSSQRVN
ncbi:MAG TPA: isopentenyl transferase family protein, partial [Bacteroidales bacterium]|nr:isopentenyl transferase family protein [Bacteroidales bacterium]